MQKRNMNRKSAKKNHFFKLKETRPKKVPKKSSLNHLRIFLKTEKSLKKFLATMALCCWTVHLRTASTLCVAATPKKWSLKTKIDEICLNRQGQRNTHIGKGSYERKEEENKRTKLVWGRHPTTPLVELFFFLFLTRVSQKASKYSGKGLNK